MMFRFFLCALLASCVAADYLSDYNRAYSACVSTPMNNAQFTIAKLCANKLQGAGNMGQRMAAFNQCVAVSNKGAQKVIDSRTLNCIAGKLNTNLNASDNKKNGARTVDQGKGGVKRRLFGGR